MREIKFRAWNKEKSRMIYVDKRITLHISGDGHFTITRPNIYSVIDDHFDCVLMQYTGLKDKNGKEIYESDILSGWIYEYSGNFEVIFDDGAFSIKASYQYTPCLYEANPEKQMEVIGNIYENPELITGGIK